MRKAFDRRTGRRRVVEDVKDRLDIRELISLGAFDQRNQRRQKRLAGDRFLCVNHLMTSAWGIEAHHLSGNVQHIGVTWHNTGRGPNGRGSIWHRRPMLTCPDCNHARWYLYFDAGLTAGRYSCYKCLGLSHVTHQCSRGQLPLVRGWRIDTRLDHSPGMRKETRRALEWKRRKLPQRRARVTERLAHPRTKIPLNWRR